MFITFVGCSDSDSGDKGYQPEISTLESTSWHQYWFVTDTTCLITSFERIDFVSGTEGKAVKSDGTEITFTFTANFTASSTSTFYDVTINFSNGETYSGKFDWLVMAFAVDGNNANKSYIMFRKISGTLPDE
jgi:hypothetical protein